MGNEMVKAETGVAMHYRQATDVAGVCGEIVKRTAQNIQGRKYVRVEGWQAIATAHGCVASSRDVEKLATGWRAVGELRRMDTGAVIAVAEGFLGFDEPVWCGGKDVRGKEYTKRAEYACRAMAQTRAISRVCRSAFAHVVVLIDGDLSTTPAEEVPDGGFDDAPKSSARVVPVESIKRGALTPEDKAANAAGFDRPAPAKTMDLPPLVDKGNPFPAKASEPQPSTTPRYTFDEMKKLKDEAWANKRGREFDMVQAGGKGKNSYYMSVAAMKPSELEHSLETLNDYIGYLESNGKDTKYAVADRDKVQVALKAAGASDDDGYATALEDQADAQA